MDGSERPGGVMTLDQVLAHYGVKGMHWGVRGGKGTPTAAHPSSADAQSTDASKAKIQSGGTKALSTKELQELVTRLNLEQQYSKLTAEKNKLDQGHSAIKKALDFAGTGIRIYNTVNSDAAKEIRKLLTK